jgi:hypothetical protein
MLGAAEALSHAAANGEISAVQAQDELYETIIAMVERSARDDAGNNAETDAEKMDSTSGT